MTESAAGALIAIVMSLLVLPIVFLTTQAGAQGTLDRNGTVGIRTRATRRSEAAWRAGHEAALPHVKRLVIAAIIADVVCAVLMFTGPEWFGAVASLIPAAVLLIGLVPAVRAANRAANAAQ